MERSTAEVERLIAENQRLVRLTAQRYHPTRIHDQDLLQSGLIGLWEAATQWQEQGTFQPYARRCILNNMRDYLRTGKRSIQEVNQRQPEEAEDCEDDTIDHIDLIRRIEKAWPENSRERLVLIALSNGQSKLQIAVALGVQTQTVQKIAKRAYARIGEEDG